MVSHPRRSKANPKSPNPQDIRAAREAAGLSREAAAKLISGSARAWLNWEYPRDHPEYRPMHTGLWRLFQIELRKLNHRGKA